MDVLFVVATLLNFAISFVFWATLGRLLADRMFGGQPNIFIGVLYKATDPAYALVGRLLPPFWVPLAVLLLTAPVVGPLRWPLLPLLRVT